MFRNTKLFLWSSALLIAAGCGETDAVQVFENSENGASTQQLTQLDWGSDSDASAEDPLGIVRPSSEEGEPGYRITIGESLAETKLSLARPTRAFGSVRRPASLGEDFDVWGWETDGESAGVITYEGKTAMVLLIYDSVDQEFVDELRAELVQYNGEPGTPIQSAAAKYEFWSSAGSRMMLCYAKAGSQTWIASVALGHPEVMDFFRMSPQLATIDAREAQALWGTRSGETEETETSSQ